MNGTSDSHRTLAPASSLDYGTGSTSVTSPAAHPVHPALLRKSYSYAETLTEQQKMIDCQPKKKYLKRFEKIFWPLVGEERLFNCYSCALYQDSIASGHLYLTFNWFCFYSNFIGRQRQVAIDVSRIQSITQERTAKIIPNAIKISTDSDTYMFSSFISRDRAYKTLVGVWRKSEELAALSCEESDLSDVDSMTQIVAMPGYADRASPTQARSETDSTSETSVAGLTDELRESSQVEVTADVIEFAAPISVVDDELATIAPVAESSTAIATNGQSETDTPVNNHWLLWQRAEKVVLFMHSLMKWCCSNGRSSDSSETIYSSLMICTALVAAMTIYLSMKLCLFENEQLTYSIRRQLQIHDTNLQLQVEATLELNHKLISQLSDMLTVLKNIVTETGCCSQHASNN